MANAKSRSLGPGLSTAEVVAGLCYLPFDVIKIRMATGMLLVAVLLVFVCVFIRIIRDVLRPMTEGKPFESAVSDKLRKLSWISLIGGGVLSLAKMIGEIVLYNVYDLGSVFLNTNIVACSAEFKLDMTFIAVFCVLHLLSYIFKYGEELQQLSDETL